MKTYAPCYIYLVVFVSWCIGFMVRFCVSMVMMLTLAACGGTAVYTGLAAITGGLTPTGAAASGLTWDSTNVMCFTAGTLIRTAEGLVLAEEITQGM